eukprot:scaffold31057_cov29-Tisochrysis_lutea.AAC.2
MRELSAPLLLAQRALLGQRSAYIYLRLARTGVGVREGLEYIGRRRRPEQHLLSTIALHKVVVCHIIVRLREGSGRGGPDLHPRPAGA